MRQPLKSRTIGSTSDMDAMLAAGGLSRLGLDRTLSSPAAVDKERLDDDANRILGGELVVKVVDAQASFTYWSSLLPTNFLPQYGKD